MKKMNHRTFKLAVCLMAVLMLFVFTACSGGSSDNQTAQDDAAGKSDPVIDYGNSELFSAEELEEAAIQIQSAFATWEGCEMHKLSYAGDENNTAENIEWLNSLAEGTEYVSACKFLCDFHSPVESIGAWEPDHEYENYEFWLGKTAEGNFDIVSFGY